MSFAPRQQPGPSRQQRQSEMEAITIQQERDEEERRRRAEEEERNKAERERLMKEQQTAALATQQAAEASAISASTTSKPTEIEETVKIKTNPITGEQTTTLEEKVPAGVPTSIGPVSPNMEGGAAPIPLTPTATAKPVSPDMEGGAAPVAIGAGTLKPTISTAGVPTLQDTLGAADEAGATVTPGSTPATSGVDGAAASSVVPETEKSFTEQAKGFLEKFEPYKKPDEQPGLPSLGSATLGGGVGARSGGATLRPGEMPKAAMPTTPATPAMAPGVTPQVPGAGAVMQVPQPVGTQIGTPQGGMLAPGADQPGPAIPQVGGIQPVSYQVPDNDAYAMAQQQNYPMDELGNYYAPSGQVIRPGMKMADLTTVSTQTPVSPGGLAPTPNWTAQSGEKFVPDKQFYPLVGGQQFDSPAQAYMAEKEAERRQIGDGIDSAQVPTVRTEQETAILTQKNEVEGGIPGLPAVNVEDTTKTAEAQVLVSTDNPDALKKVITSETVDTEVKDIAKDNLKVATLDKVKQEKAAVKGKAIIAKAAAGDKNAPKQIANELKPSTSDEGSYFKAYLLQRFGLTELARAEQKKLGSDWARPKWQTINDDSGKVIGKVLVDYTGFAVRGIDKAGNTMTRKAIDAGNYLTYNPTLSKHQKGGGIQLAAIGTKGQPGFVEAENITYRTNPDGTIDWAKDSKGEIITDAGKLARIQTQVSTAKTTYKDRGVATATRIRDEKGVEWSQVPTKGKGMIFYDNAGNQGIPTGKTVPITVSGDVGLQKQLAETKAGVQLSYAAAIAATKAGASETGKFNALNDTNIALVTYQVPGGGTNQVLVDNNNNGAPVKVDANGNIVGYVTNTDAKKTAKKDESATSKDESATSKDEVASGFPKARPGESINEFNTRVKKYEQEQALIKKKKEAEIASVTKSNDQRVLDANNLLKTSEFSQAVGSQELIPGYIKLLTEGKTNFGGLLQYQVALGDTSVEQYIENLVKTEEGRNTKQILDLINETILPGVKALGANPTDTDLQFIIKYKPKVTDPPQDIAQYLRRVQKVFNRAYSDAQKIIETNGTHVPKFEIIKGEVDKSNPLLQGVN